MIREVNPVVTENRRKGNADWRLTNPATDREIEGYASNTSINRGEGISLYINTYAQSFSLQVYRMGWYEGLGARSVFGPIELTGTIQTMPEMDSETGLVDCAWVKPFVLNTSNTNSTNEWQSGIYLVKLTELAQGKQSCIVFVVRDDARKADLLVQQSVTTFQAYNNWGGKSLYKWNSTDNKRASKISFNRPYAINGQNPAAAYGVGAGEFICNVQPNNPDYPISNAGWEINMVRWLEREGYDVCYCTNLDVHQNPLLLINYRAFLSVGHDEYWSLEMRNNLENALQDGKHLGFFSANTGYWQIRLEASQVNQQSDRIMVCHKSATRDPNGKLGEFQHLTTCKWREAPLNNPEARLIGVMYATDPVDGDIVISNAGHWVFAGTGLVNGSRLVGLSGYEVDCVDSSSPDNIEILAESSWKKLNDYNQTGNTHMTLYASSGRAYVFATGSIQWSWGLDDFNVPELRSSRLNPAAQQITRNVLQRFISSSQVT
ncbi:hypothetical protein MCAMS1_01449 [biofilm metagenome]